MSDVLDRVLAALKSSIDDAKFRAAFGEVTRAPSPVASTGTAGAIPAALERLTLSDVLDDAILQARPGDSAFPLRVLLGDGAAKLADSDAAFAFMTGLNFYFRASVEEDTKVLLAFEVSRAFYRFGKEIEREVVVKSAPLLARILSTQLELITVEDIETARVFDSNAHERSARADLRGEKIVEAESFLCRVRASGLVKRKAQVRT
ncbi:MAG: hypothetical protein U0174_24400 [Polyangiaceae bacterium]